MEIRLDKNETFATLTLNAPDRRNALTPAMAERLSEALAEVERDRALCALVLRGEGGYFCAGADRAMLARAAEDPAADAMFRGMDAIYQSFRHLAELSVPTIAAVRGGAVGAGVNLAMAADVRILAEDAVLRAGFIRIGAVPGGGHFSLLERVAGRESTAALTLLEDAVSGDAAVRRGFALEALPDAEVEDRAAELAARPRDPDLVRQATQAMRAQAEAVGVPWAVALRAEQAAQMWSLRRSAAAA